MPAATNCQLPVVPVATDSSANKENNASRRAAFCTPKRKPRERKASSPLTPRSGYSPSGRPTLSPPRLHPANIAISPPRTPRTIRCQGSPVDSYLTPTRRSSEVCEMPPATASPRRMTMLSKKLKEGLITEQEYGRLLLLETKTQSMNNEVTCHTSSTTRSLT